MAMKRRRKQPRARRTAQQVLAALRLPTAGEVPFVPPKGWTPSQPLPRGEQQGYIDRFRREWVKGPSRTAGEHFEWDVQLANGDHLNVSLTGRITHPRPKE
jgi:filamentous hemagglutinin